MSPIDDQLNAMVAQHYRYYETIITDPAGKPHRVLVTRYTEPIWAEGSLRWRQYYGAVVE